VTRWTIKADRSDLLVVMPPAATKFLEVANLMQQPTALLSPANALKVWNGSRDMQHRDLGRGRQAA